MKIGVYCNNQKDPDGSVCSHVMTEAKRLGCDAVPFSKDTAFDLVVSIGGDGTILRVAKDCARVGVPILGVNKGTVGFLTEVEPEKFSDALERIIRRDYFLERRALIDATFCGKHYYALNDVVILRSGGGRVINMEIRVDTQIIDKFTCDGYIACTPTGSTAYSLSAGGSVIGPNTPVIALTPINPHTLRTKPIVVGSFETVDMKYSGAVGAALYVDGEYIVDMKSDETVTVTGWDKSALFVRFDKQSFYSRLLGKLNSWSAGE